MSRFCLTLLTFLLARFGRFDRLADQKKFAEPSWSRRRITNHPVIECLDKKFATVSFVWIARATYRSLMSPGHCRNLGHRDALQSWRHRDEDAIKTPAEGVGLVFAATPRTSGKGRSIPQAGTARPQQGGMG